MDPTVCPEFALSHLFKIAEPLLTDVAYPIKAIGQLYRDRADCENGFDELKNL